VSDAPGGDGGAGGGTLYVVATPIGHLGDVTLRALEVLRAVPLIAAEDTRISHRLLARNGIETPMTSLHAHSSAARLATLLEHLRAGHDLAVVTDAGTPAVSDPGAEVVVAWADAGGRVVPVPGASAVLAAVAATGIAGPRWSFEGFLPRSGRERRERIARIAADPRGSLVYEAPGRVAATLRDLATACGPGRAGAACRELTKRHETIVRGRLGEVVLDDPRGELTIVVEGPAPDAAPAESARPADLDAEVRRLLADGRSPRDAARELAERFGIARREAYSRVLAHGRTPVPD